MSRFFATFLAAAILLLAGISSSASSTTGIEWARALSGPGGWVFPFAVARDGDGNLYLAGQVGKDQGLPSSLSFMLGSVTTPLAGAYNQGFVAKLDPVGTVIWVRAFGGGSDALDMNLQVSGLAVGAAGEIYIGGSYLLSSPVSMNACDNRPGTYVAPTSPPMTGKGLRDAFVLKFDGAGNLLWHRNFGGSGTYAYATGLATDTTGAAYLAGWFSCGNIDAPSANVAGLTRIGPTDGFVIGLSADGTAIAAGNYGGAGASVQLQGVAANPDGGLYLTGSLSGAGMTRPALALNGVYDAIVMKADAVGAVVWARGIGGSAASVLGLKAAASRSGLVHLVGNFSGGNIATPFSLPKFNSNGSGFVATFDANGTVRWARRFGGDDANVSGYDLVADADGNVYVAGYRSGSGNMTVPALTAISTAVSTGADEFAIKFDSSGSLIWSGMFGGPTAVAQYGKISAGGDGSLYLAGYFSAGDLTVPPLPLTAKPTSNPYALQYTTYLMKVATSAGTQPAVTPESGFYYTPGANGRGVAVEVAGERAMIGMFAYTAAGGDVWYTGTCALSSSGSASCSGDLTEFAAGTPFSDLGSAARAPQAIGAAASFTLTWPSSTAATLRIVPTGAAAASYALNRFPISGATITAAPSWAPQTGWWYAPDYGGTGWFLEAQNDRTVAGSAAGDLFLVGFAYGGAGQANWWAGTVALGAVSAGAAGRAALAEYGGGPTLDGAGNAGLMVAAQRGALDLTCASPLACVLVLPNGRSLSIRRFSSF